MNKVLLLVATAAFAAVASAQSVAYSNTTTYLQTGYLNGGATTANPITTLVADDITFASGFAGASVSSFTFNVANFDTTAFTARPRIRFYGVDTTTGGPGAYLTGFSFSPISFAASTLGLYTYSGTNLFTIPAGNKIWAGITFDNVGATATVANLNNLGQGVYNPPTVGSSADMFFQTTTAGSFLQDSPTGSMYKFSSGAVANFGWAFSATPAAVPEPATWAVLGLGFTALLRRRKRS